MSPVIQGSFPHGLRGPLQRMGAYTVVDVSRQLAHMPQAGGQPLPNGVLQRMERAFGTSFAEVRVHVGPEAASIGAVAFTRGAHIYFAPGQYNPMTGVGQRLLGHELAHVVQQRSGRVRGPIGKGTTILHDQVLEAEAERASVRVVTQPVAQRMKASPPQPARARPIVQPSNAVQPLFGWLWSLFTPQPPVVLAPATNPQPSPEEILAQNERHFRTTGRPSRIDPRIYDEVDEVAWAGITNLGGKAKNRKKYKPSNIVRAVFSNFIRNGYKYELMINGATAIIAKGQEAEASCLGLARAFADILNAFGIKAEAKYVRTEDEGRFITRVDNFIDANVHGHIYDGNILKRNYYVFSSHAATWVESENRYYDPMAKISYQSFDPYIVCELDSDVNQTVFTPKIRHIPGLELSSGRAWKLVKTEEKLPGGFYKLKMVPRVKVKQGRQKRRG